MLTGDFNAQTSVLDDCLQVDLSLHIPVSDEYKVDTVLDKRVSQDSKVNEYGRKLINLCISTGLRIVNGRLHEDKDMGKYTYIKKRGCSVVDYVIGSSDLFKYIHNFKVNDHTSFSDHNSIELSLPSI